ncbi:MAG: 6-phosphofructokinase [Erysipelotrichaceae bacterium]|nr:6-phosphofructokinase [Erysipelotrichaceae bacterium]
MAHKIGILTSGGDAPGMNAAIRAVTRAALKRGMEVYGIMDGYKGLVKGKIVEFDRGSVSDIMIRGGTILGSARLPEFKDEEVRKEAVEQLKKYEIDSLVVIGGDGTYRGALSLTEMGINCIGIPGTIDNDIVGTDFTIGFDTALNTILDAVDKLRDTSSSHHRCSVVEVMGNHCGDLALYTAISCGAEVVISPETGFDEDKVIKRLQELEKIKKKRHAIVILSEKITNAHKLADKITENTGFSGRATVLGHIQRGGSPTANDRILATKMGDYAVKLIEEGKGGHCVGIIDNEIVGVPIDKALHEERQSRKRMYDMFDRLV